MILDIYNTTVTCIMMLCIVGVVFIYFSATQDRGTSLATSILLVLSDCAVALTAIWMLTL